MQEIIYRLMSEGDIKQVAAIEKKIHIIFNNNES